MSITITRTDDVAAAIRRGQQVEALSYAAAALPGALGVDVSNLTPETSQAVAEHQARLADLRARYRKVAESQEIAVDRYVQRLADGKVTEGGAGDLFVSAEAAKIEAFGIVEEAIQILRTVPELLGQVIDGLTEAHDNAEQELARVAEEVTAELTAAGQGLEAQRSWPVDPSAAERQLAFTVRQNIRVRQKTDALNMIGENLTRARQLINENRAASQQAVGILRAMAIAATRF